MVLNSDVVEEFKNTSTIHGLSRFGGPEFYSRRRLIWIVLVLSAASALMIFVILEFIHLSKNPTTTIFSQVLRKDIEFPAVTLCNMNQVKNTVTKCLTEYEEEEIRNVFYSLSEISIILEKFGLNVLKAPIPGNLIQSCALNHSHQLDDMITYCHFRQQAIPCSNIFVPKMTEYGQCYTFNADGKERAFAIGEGAGLRFFVNIQQDQYFFASTIRAGIKIVLHDPSEEPLPSLRGYLVGPGLSASGAIRKTVITTLPSPYGSCRQQSDDITGVGTYSELTCFKRCFDEHITGKCGCRHFFQTGRVEVCNSAQLMTCYARSLRNVTTDYVVFQNCSCPPNCKTTKYETVVSYAFFSSEYISNFLHINGVLPSKNFTDKNFIDIRLFYNTMMEDATTEVPEKSIGGILGTLGGQMGMFIGASLLSIVELVEFIFLLISRSSQKITTSKRRPSDMSNEQLDIHKESSKI